MFTYSGGGRNARDRWFDKGVSHIFYKNGLFACNCDVIMRIFLLFLYLLQIRGGGDIGISMSVHPSVFGYDFITSFS